MDRFYCSISLQSDDGVWQSALPMADRTKESPAGHNDDAVVEVLHTLTQELRVLRDVLDEIREQLSWSLRNDHFHRGNCPVLKQMSRDPTADNWSDHLVIARHEASSESGIADQTTELTTARDIIRDLLNTTELNLDEMEEGTRQAIERAQQIAGQSASSTSNGPDEPDAERPMPEFLSESARPSSRRDRLF